ncbi:MAG: hypothetical protein II747_01405, partial [Clostridia bacterium]|nr:hypothetical protein [Clostridia bacterium]
SKQLQRKKFADTLNSIFVLRNLYIKMCEKKEIVFCGQWPENQRPATGIDDIDYRIYKLDIRERKDIHID